MTETGDVLQADRKRAERRHTLRLQASQTQLWFWWRRRHAAAHGLPPPVWTASWEESVSTGSHSSCQKVLTTAEPNAGGTLSLHVRTPRIPLEWRRKPAQTPPYLRLMFSLWSSQSSLLQLHQFGDRRDVWWERRFLSALQLKDLMTWWRLWNVLSDVQILAGGSKRWRRKPTQTSESHAADPAWHMWPTTGSAPRVTASSFQSISAEHWSLRRHRLVRLLLPLSWSELRLVWFLLWFGFGSRSFHLILQ